MWRVVYGRGLEHCELRRAEVAEQPAAEVVRRGIHVARGRGNVASWLCHRDRHAEPQAVPAGDASDRAGRRRRSCERRGHPGRAEYPFPQEVPEPLPGHALHDEPGHLVVAVRVRRPGAGCEREVAVAEGAHLAVEIATLDPREGAPWRVAVDAARLVQQLADRDRRRGALVARVRNSARYVRTGAS